MKIVIVEEKSKWGHMRKFACSKVQFLPKNPKKGIKENSISILISDEDIEKIEAEKAMIFEIEATTLKEKMDVLAYPAWQAKNGILKFSCDPEICGDYIGVGGSFVKRAAKWIGLIVRYNEPKLIWIDDEMEGTIQATNKFNVQTQELKEGIRMSQNMFRRIPKEMKGECIGTKLGKTFWVAPWYDFTNLLK